MANALHVLPISAEALCSFEDANIVAVLTPAPVSPCHIENIGAKFPIQPPSKREQEPPKRKKVKHGDRDCRPLFLFRERPGHPTARLGVRATCACGFPTAPNHHTGSEGAGDGRAIAIRLGQSHGELGTP